MTPNDVLPTVAVRPGWPRFAWLNRLNTSTRSCARALPCSFTFLMIEKSVLPKPGPYIGLRTRLPKCATPAALYGSAKTDDAVHAPVPPAEPRGSQHVV